MLNFTLLFLSFLLGLGAHSLSAQTEDSADTTSDTPVDSVETTPNTSFFVPQLRAFQFDVAKIVLCADAELNADVDLFRLGTDQLWLGIRGGWMNTGEDELFCLKVDFAGTPHDCNPPQYNHLDLLGYTSAYFVVGRNVHLRLSLLAGISKISGRDLPEMKLPVKVGGEFQVRLTNSLSIGLGASLPLHYPDVMGPYLPLKFNVGYARW